MTVSPKRSLLNILFINLSFILSKWFYDSFLATYAHYISSYGMTFALALNAIITILLTYFTFILFHLVYTRQITSKTLMASYFLYGLLLLYVLFFKNIGVQGYSLNPLSFIGEIKSGSHFVPVMNLLMFIPLGCLFVPSKENLFLSFLVLLLVESCQYVFHLGVFDLGDITLNLASILIGSLLHHFFFEKWLRKHLVTDANHFLM